MEFKTGALVEFRGRPWVVQQSGDPEVLLLKPLNGTESESCGLYLPLYGDELKLASYHFNPPDEDDLMRGGQGSVQDLYDACRLSFRDTAGPFHCLGKISFEPRPYQLVPLILALKQQKVRLMISDDVGVGKTLEALLIAKELLDRKEISGFTVICLPHLCEQWQNEIKDKFGLNAEIIRSSTVSRLEKNLRGNQNVFHDIPYQIVSIDYIKTDERYESFANLCHDFVIVDEAHTCACPTGANKSQQLRYRLLNTLAQKPDQQLVLLTATPHSGHDSEFKSLLGLLDPKFQAYELQDPKERKELARYFIQRRRGDIKPYLGAENAFPKSKQLKDEDSAYSVSAPYNNLLNDLIEYIKKGVHKVEGASSQKRRYTYWDLLALMRGVMSSPAAGISMLENKISKKEEESDPCSRSEADSGEIFKFNDDLKDLLGGDDDLPSAYDSASNYEKSILQQFAQRLGQIKANNQDQKVIKAIELVKYALSKQKNPIVFCQYIQTAEYVGKIIAEGLKSNKKTVDVAVETVTSRLADEERKLKIDDLTAAERHVLVCTDCLSEGVNLQQGFDCVIHYDLPWNPNRLEQRNGRIDRFGQISPEVLIATMHSANNQVDKIILNVLYKKQREIKKRLGIYLPITENDASLMESIMNELLELKTAEKEEGTQTDLFEKLDRSRHEQQIDQDIERTAHLVEQELKTSQTYYAHNNEETNPLGMIQALEQAKEIIGGVDDTEHFTLNSLRSLGVAPAQDALHCYSFSMHSLPVKMRNLGFFKPDPQGRMRISFCSPTPRNFTYIGRNHALVDYLSRKTVSDSVSREKSGLAKARALVMATAAVQQTTTVMLMRVRSVISDLKQADRELVGEEMLFIGYRGSIEERQFIDKNECKKLFLGANAAGNLSQAQRIELFHQQAHWIESETQIKNYTDNIALERAQALINSFNQYRSYVPDAPAKYQVVKPVLPMDVFAVCIFVPEASAL